MNIFTEKELISKWHEHNAPLVSICTITYNHEEYIGDAIESFLMQETTFPFEILVHDDASTDKTQLIIKKYEKLYPNIIKPIYQTVNQKSKFKSGMNPRFNYPRALGKYIAICDGDDYWIDPNKLQKQVNFLESNTDYGLTHSGYKLLEKDSPFYNIKRNIPIGYVYDSLLENSFIGTLTVLFRRSIYNIIENQAKEIFGKYIMGDRIQWLSIARVSKINYSADITAVYRKHSNSVSFKRNLMSSLTFFESSYKLRLHFIMLYGCQQGIKKRVSINYYSGTLNYCYKLIDYPKAKQSYLELRKLHNNTCRNYLQLIGSRNKLLNLFVRITFYLCHKLQKLHYVSFFFNNTSSWRIKRNN